MITVDLTRPQKLYRYARCRWNVKSLLAGEFRLAPASEYESLSGDAARQDNELIREETTPGHMVTVTHVATGRPIKVTGDMHYRDEVGTDYYTLCMSTTWDPVLFTEFTGSSSCLVIHDPERFCERVHLHVEKRLENWAGIDAPVSYLQKSRLGPAFSKPWKYLAQKEWRFAWHPPIRIPKLFPIFIRIGRIDDIAELVSRPFDPGDPNG